MYWVDADQLDAKNSCQALADVDVDVNNCPATVDGVEIGLGTRLLLIAQTPPPGKLYSPANGIYECTTAAAPFVLQRAPDCNEIGEMTPAFFTFIEAGETYAHTGWLHTSPGAVMGLDGIRMQRFTGLGRVQVGSGLDAFFGGAVTSYKDYICVLGTADRIQVTNAGVNIDPDFTQSIIRYGLAANLPASAQDVGTLYLAYDTGGIYRWNGVSWDLLASTTGITLVSPPPTYTSPGTVGQFAVDTDFFYYCVAPNQWRRTPAGIW